MPFIQQVETQKLYPPTSLPGVSEGDWIEIKSVFTAGMRREFIRQSWQPAGGTDIFAWQGALIQGIVVGWSDPSPVTPEALESLHPDVATWIGAEFDRLAAGRGAEEKKD